MRVHNLCEHAIPAYTSHAILVAIKKRYYKLCFEFHPDRLNAQHTTNKSTAETRESAIRTAKQKFQQISEAYRVIGHPARRREYDNRLLPASRRSGGGAAAGQSGYSPFKRSRPSETERRRWQEATRPIYRTQSGDELRNRMWRRSNWLYEANQRNKNKRGIGVPSTGYRGVYTIDNTCTRSNDDVWHYDACLRG
ncbi:hypothetical protein BDF22DRAFT_733622 [Syncephalis plumigaleata]|nr:hypothetical protein BDF22DRAFT_733622 [Syncephalis plumigaleata]